MQQPNVISGYIVELFRPNRLIRHDAVDRKVREFRAGLENLKGASDTADSALAANCAIWRT